MEPCEAKQKIWHYTTRLQKTEKIYGSVLASFWTKNRICKENLQQTSRVFYLLHIFD